MVGPGGTGTDFGVYVLQPELTLGYGVIWNGQRSGDHSEEFPVLLKETHISETPEILKMDNDRGDFIT